MTKTTRSPADDSSQTDNPVGMSGSRMQPSESAHPVDKGWAWVIMIGVFGVHFMSFGYIRSFGILFVEFQTKFEASSAMTAVVIGVQFCTYSLSTFLAMKVITKHFSFRQTCLLGCALESLGILLNGVVTDIRFLIVTQGVVFGSGLAFLYCPTLIVISHYFNKKRALATAIASCGVSAGGVILPPLIRYFLDSYGLRGGLMLLAAVMFNQAAFASLFTPTNNYTFTPAVKTSSRQAAGDDPHADKKQFEISNEQMFPSTLSKDQSPERVLLKYDLLIKESEDSSPLLELTSMGLPAREITQEIEGASSSNENHKHVQQDTTADVGDTDLPNSVTASLLSGQSDRTALKSSLSKPDTLQIDSKYKAKARMQETSMPKDHNRDNNDEKRRFPREDVSPMVAENPPHKPSLKSAILQVLSTSTADLHCSLPSLIQENLLATEQSNGKVNKEEKLNHESRWRCRIPAVVKTFTFWVMLVFFVGGWVGSSLPNIFIPPLAKEKGLNDEAALLLMVSALAELVGRLTPGIILHFGFLRPHSVLIVPMGACATLYQFTGLFNDFGALVFMSVLSGVFTGTFWTTQSLVVIEVFGLEKLGSMLGLYFPVAGFSVGASNPIGGLLKDVSGTYAATFHFFGAMYYLATTMMIIVHFIKRRARKNVSG